MSAESTGGPPRRVVQLGRRFGRKRASDEALQELAEVLRVQLKAHKKTRYSFYQELGVDSKTVRRWLAGETIPDYQHQEGLRQLLGEDVFDAIEKAREARAERQVRSGYDVFLAAPIRAAENTIQVVDAYVRPLYEALVAAGRTVYWAGASISSDDDVDPPAVALARSSDALIDARLFVYAHVPGLNRPSSALIQAGMALARHMPVTVVCDDAEDLPSLFQTEAHHIYRTMREFAPVQVVSSKNFIRYAKKISEYDFLEVVY